MTDRVTVTVTEEIAMANKGYQGSNVEYAKGGPGNSSVSKFLKTEDEFRDSTNKASDEDWGKTGKTGDITAKLKTAK